MDAADALVFVFLAAADIALLAYLRYRRQRMMGRRRMMRGLERFVGRENARHGPIGGVPALQRVRAH